MENNLEKKAKYFAVYYGQDCLTAGNANIDNLFENWGEDIIFKTQYLLLKPLSSITDDDAIEFIRIGWDGYKNISITQKYNNGVDFSFEYETSKRRRSHSCRIDYISTYRPQTHQIDYLRSKGYALPFMGLSVERIIEYGWLKIATS